MLLQNLWMFKYPIFLRWVGDKCCRHISEILFVKELFFLLPFKNELVQFVLANCHNVYKTTILDKNIEKNGRYYV